jgi:hypothetical protein
MTTTNDNLDPLDRAALECALSLTMAEAGPDRIAQVQAALKDEGWFAAAWGCVYNRQIDALGLTPWERPPCCIDDADAAIAAGPEGQYGHRDYAAGQLLARMLSHGVSKFDPDPLGAIAKAATGAA